MWLDQTCWHGVRAQTYSVFTVLVRLMRVAIIKKNTMYLCGSTVSGYNYL